MKQVILIKPGKIEIRDVPVPEPSEGEVVVKIHTALTCGTDLKAYDRGHTLIPMPGPFGHEYSGTVAKTGKRVNDFREGDSVMGVHSAPCNECRCCKRGLYNLCEVIMETKALGAFSEYLLLPASIVKQNLFHKPDDLSFEEAALLEPLSCVVHPYDGLNLNGIETAAVLGAGPIGLMHLSFLKSWGIKVIVSEYFDDRHAQAVRLGAFRVTVPHDAEDAVKDTTGGFGADLAVECTGQQGVWEKAVRYVRRGGTVILFGGCPAGTNVTYDAGRLHYDELTLTGSFHFTPQDVKTAYQLLVDKSLDLSSLISGTIPLKNIEKAFSLLKEGKGIKYALKP
jgi:L-iditol 2-dehydrogenase